MRYSLSWLGRYVDLSGVDLDWLADRFILSVAEIDAVERLGAGLTPVQVARVRTVAPHPGADRLKLCTIEAGGTHEVVCGAPNVREGMLTAFAPPGTRLGELEVKAAEIRGVQSAGMLCSEKELGLTDEHSGILDLEGDFEPGTAFSEVADLRDVVWEVDNKSITHRPDLWSHVGVAREVASLLGRPLSLPPAEVQLSDEPAPDIEVHAPVECPRYLAVGLTGIRIAPAPLWMRVLVNRCGMRPISNVVDATNFAMLEMGNPLHAFDAREVLGRKIVVRMARDGERVVTLDEKERSLTEADLLICDSQRPVAIAGVMGLENSEVKEDTADVILESANFRAETVRRTALRLGLRTEASSRFEKSLDPNLPPAAARRFAHLLCEVCPGAKVSSALGDFAAGPFEPKLVRTSVSYVNRRLGTDLPKETVHSHLNGLELEVTDLDGDEMEVTVPTFRAMRDIGIPEDLVEEVGRLHGYDHITPVQPKATIPAPYRQEDRTLHRRLRLGLSLQAGFTEVQRYSFDFEPFLERVGRGPWPRIVVKNPISVELTHLRPRLLPGLLQALETGLGSARTLRLYEIGRVFSPAEPGAELPPQPFHLALCLWRHQRNAAELPGTPKDADFGWHQRRAYTQLKGVIEDLSSRLMVPLTARRAEATELPPWLHPVRSAAICGPEGALLGAAGALHPDVTDELECGPFAAAAELSLEPLVRQAPPQKPYEPILRFPPVPIDLSVIVPEAVTHAEVVRRINEAHPEWVREAELTGVYRGDPIPEGQKSMTYAISFQSAERTLEMEEVNELVAFLMERLAAELEGWVRM